MSCSTNQQIYKEKHENFLVNISLSDLRTANTNLQPPNFTQVFVHQLLEYWGYEGFLEHCNGLAIFYSKQLEGVERAAKKHLKGLANWTSPQAGMFLWMKLNIAQPGNESNADSYKLIAVDALKEGIRAVPGKVTPITLTFINMTLILCNDPFRTLFPVARIPLTSG